MPSGLNDPEIVRGIERITGETYDPETGRWTGLPEHWPPQPGDVWTDASGEAWFCQAVTPARLFMVHQGNGMGSAVTGEPRSLGSLSVQDSIVPRLLRKLEWRSPH